MTRSHFASEKSPGSTVRASTQTVCWLTAAWWLLASRAAILAIGIVGAALFVNQQTLEVAGPQALDPATVWQKWDAVWYERIARDGYAAGPNDPTSQAKAGFFPLYPWLIARILSLSPSMSFFWVASILSNLLTFIALAWLMTSLAPDLERARRALLLTVTAAGSFYFSIPYTESLFLLLVVAAMAFTRDRRYLLAAAACGLGAATRIHGLALIAIPVIACLRETGTPWSTTIRRLALMGVLFALPLAIHMLHLSDVQGDAGAFVTRQAMWDNALPYPLKAIAGFLIYPRRLSGWVHGLVWFLYVGLLVRYWRRMPLGEALFCAGALLISTQQETFHGIYRYVMVLVPMTLALADDRQDLRHAIIAFNLVFGTIMILAFVTNNRLVV
jgi:Gpi18-like mannosyltransferase